MNKPKKVTDAQKAFGACEGYLPKAEDIPKDFWQFDGTKWNKAINEVRFNGKLPSLVPKKGIDPQAAWDHITACLRSWTPKDEHKEAGCSYLMSLWYDDII